MTPVLPMVLEHAWNANRKKSVHDEINERIGNPQNMLDNTMTIGERKAKERREKEAKEKAGNA